MAVLSKGNKFPLELTPELMNLVKGKSSLMRLSAAEPIPFNGKEMFTFNLDKEIEVVGENEKKSDGGATMGSVSITPVKVVYSMRCSDEFRYAAQAKRVDWLRAFSQGLVRKIAKGFDLMAFHGINPRTGNAAATQIGNNHFDYQVTKTVYQSAVSANATVEAAIAEVGNDEWGVSGLIAAPSFRADLAKEIDGDNRPIFPELKWGAAPVELNGLPFEVNGTVNYGNSPDVAIVGDFAEYFRWGYAKEVMVEMIEYGDPDNTGVDLKGSNQVCLRGEAYIGWAIMIPEAFCRVLKSPSITLDKLTDTVAAGSTTALTATTYPAGETVTWATSKASVATVSDGTVTGVAAGKAKITASITVDGVTYTASCEVTVTGS